MAWQPQNEADFDKAYYSGLTDTELCGVFSANYGQLRHYLTGRYTSQDNALERRGEFQITSDVSLTDELAGTDLRVLKLINSNNKSISIFDLCDKLDLAPKRVQESLQRLKVNNYAVDVVNNQLLITQTPKTDHTFYASTLREGKTFKFGALGDNHGGSKYERLDLCEAAYDIFEENGVNHVFHTGNYLEGEARFNKNDILVHGMTNQVKHFVDTYPSRENITTHFVTGDDHEGWYYQQQGIDIGAYTEMEARKVGREDLHNLGYLEANVLIGDDAHTKLRIMHPGGGSSYAVSYKPQKIVEALDVNDRPDILLIGHYHKSMYLMHQGVHIYQTGTLKDQDLFMRKFQLAAHLGVWIIEFTQLPDGSVGRITSTWYPFSANHWKHL
jgi:predicted phosphodiesterase